MLTRAAHAPIRVAHHHIAETLAYLSAKILIDYLLQEPRYLYMNFVWRITPILKKICPFWLSSYICWCWFQQVKTDFPPSKLVRFFKQILDENISAPVRDNLSKFSLIFRLKSQLSHSMCSWNTLTRMCPRNALVSWRGMRIMGHPVCVCI